MGKAKKKRNKQYRGKDAAMTRTNVTRISAEHRSPLKQWWLDNKRVAKPLLIAGGVLLVIIILIVEIVRITTA